LKVKGVFTKRKKMKNKKEKNLGRPKEKKGRL